MAAKISGTGEPSIIGRHLAPVSTPACEATAEFSAPGSAGSPPERSRAGTAVRSTDTKEARAALSLSR